MYIETADPAGITETDEWEVQWRFDDGVGNSYFYHDEAAARRAYQSTKTYAPNGRPPVEVKLAKRKVTVVIDPWSTIEEHHTTP